MKYVILREEEHIFCHPWYEYPIDWLCAPDEAFIWSPIAMRENGGEWTRTSDIPQKHWEVEGPECREISDEEASMIMFEAQR